MHTNDSGFFVFFCFRPLDSYTTNETLYDMPYAYKKFEIVFKAGKVLKAAHTHPYTHRVSYTQSHKADGGRVIRNNGFQSPASDAPQYLIGRNGHGPDDDGDEFADTGRRTGEQVRQVQHPGRERRLQVQHQLRLHHYDDAYYYAYDCADQDGCTDHDACYWRRRWLR